MAHSPAPGVLKQCGVVRTGELPIAGAEVTLLQAGRGAGATPRVLAHVRTGSHGEFGLIYRRPVDPTAVLYLTADVGQPSRERSSAGHPAAPVELAAALGSPSSATTPSSASPVVINERTTVAAGYALAQFIGDRGVSGTYPGLQNAAAISHNLADVTTGQIAPLLASPPNGALTSTLATFNTLADLVAGCVAGQTCQSLFALAQPPGKAQPTNTLQAVADIARTPSNNVPGLFALAAVKQPYTPTLTAAPDAWTLAIRYDGNGHELDGPGNLAFDADGNAWVTNNYPYNPNPFASVCGDTKVIKLAPTGQDAPGAPYRGGGLYGAGFGITLDPKGHTWVANFGFQGSQCPVNASLFYRSVSEFGPRGAALSPPTGWRNGNIVQPQGMASDRQGTIWIANCGGSNVVEYPHGRPELARTITPPASLPLVKPFDIAVDPMGRKWVTDNGTNSVLMMSADGVPQRSITTGGLRRPLGIASDSLGNVWVANPGILPVPCGGDSATDFANAVQNAPSGGGGVGGVGGTGGSVTMIGPDGSTPAQPFMNGGIVLPWGVAVDGDDTVWVSNFGGRRLVHLCGARLSSCPPGYRAGQPISPAATGYTSDSLARNTGVQIDPSGNVWLANNWLTVPVQTNPGAHEVVVFIGMAAPVRTPLLGAPRRP
ncbi:NHL repeat containing protein [Catenulispora acidiphila DSM 44928]|uniref:NHL repeat containing protein n=2 Tax=Catenulispora TaxID=414878 RepID=C7Q0C9_CATAD|nr:NHL repeat containing protein [Catenulispora acidiphila DSM 44928]